MKFLYMFFILCLCLNAKGDRLSIGQALPMETYTLKDVSGKTLTLGELKRENGLLVIFSCNTCPWVIAWQDRYNEIAEIAKNNNVGIVFVNSNAGKRSGADSYEKMQEHAKKNRYSFYYAVDKNNQLADAFGATKTPDLFLFDAKAKLAYVGAIDDNAEDASKVNRYYIKDALTALGTNKTIATAKTKSVGCSIKRI